LKTENVFKDMVSRQDGMRISDAIKKAEAKVEAYKSTGLAAIDDKIVEMQTICTRLKGAPAAADERKIYLLANDVFASAGTFGQPELSEAAYSLCDLLGNRPENVPLVWDAINVHIASMKLLRQSSADTDSEARQAVLAGLKQVTARLTLDAANAKLALA
jgi:hypothetical protein